MPLISKSSDTSLFGLYKNIDKLYFLFSRFQMANVLADMKATLELLKEHNARKTWEGLKP